MHAKAHSWHCQVLWGGRWQDGAAGGSGKDMEQIFSYLSRLNLTMKNMTAAGMVFNLDYYIYALDYFRANVHF